MKLNIVTKEPAKVGMVLQNQFPTAKVEHSPISSEIHNFEVLETGDVKVYSLESLIEFAGDNGFSFHDIRLY